MADSQKTPSPEERVRKAIDNICGDTWCEGDYQFEFKTVTFDKSGNQTLVDFTMTPYSSEQAISNEDKFSSVLVSPSFQVRCIVKGYSDVSKIIDQDQSLNWDFYEAMTDCVSSLEQNLVK